MEIINILLLGMFLEISFDWPKFIYKKIKHPIVWIGNLINFLDKTLNKAIYSNHLKKILGLFTLIICLSINLLIFYMIYFLIKDYVFLEIFYVIIVWTMICSRSLYSHTKRIEIDIKKNDLKRARKSLSSIVGRETKDMSKQAIIRSTLESLSESTCDGIVAPIFWYFILGLPGLIVYKTINTLDSMIGYKTNKYLEFGFVSAKVDDVINFFPSRFTGLIFVILSKKPLKTLKIMLKDAPKTRSPNAGWPEAAFAGALSIRLGGPKVYLGRKSNDQWLNVNCKNPNEEKLTEGLILYKKLIFFIFFLLSIITFLKFIKIL